MYLEILPSQYHKTYYIIKSVSHREHTCVCNCSVWFKAIENKMCTIACLHTELPALAEGCAGHGISCCMREWLHQHWEKHSKNRNPMKCASFAGRANISRGFTCSTGLMPQVLRLIFPQPWPSACWSSSHEKDGEADGALWAAGLSSTVLCRCALSRDRCLNCLGLCLLWLPSLLLPVENCRPKKASRK